MRSWAFLPVALLLVLPGAASSAVAGPADGARIVIELAPDHSSIVLPESRRATVTVHVKGWAEGFACALEGTVWIDTYVTFAHEWAGASMNPAAVDWRLEPPGPLLVPASFHSDRLRLDIYWGEDFPPGAHETYTITPEVGRVTGPCLPEPEILADPTTVTVWAPGSDPHP